MNTNPNTAALLTALKNIVDHDGKYIPFPRLHAAVVAIEETQQSIALAGAESAQSATETVAPLMRNFVGGQPAQAISVGSPESGRAGGDAVIVVEVYALGRGVSLAGEQSDLASREGAFKLKANGKIFVFDPIGGAKSNWLVAPVQRDVAAISQPLDAVDQEDEAQFRGVAGHDQSPLRTVILSLPQGMGKTILGVGLANRLGLASIKDEWTPYQPIEPGALHLTHTPVEDFLDQPPAGTESAQSATENIAFSCSRIQPKIDQQYSDQAWLYGGKAFDACISRCGLSFIKRVYSDGQSISVDVRITAAEAREMAAVLLSAADFAEANPDFGKVPA